MNRFLVLSAILASFVYGCSSSTVAPDDGGTTHMDGSGGGHDSGITFDAGSAPDGFVILPDGAVVGPDGAVLLPDGGVFFPDAGPILGDGSMPTLTGGIGAGCTSAADCTMVAGATCETAVGGGFTFPGGYCTMMCGMGVDCGAGAACVPFVNFCAKTCTTDADCRTAEGYTCGMVPGGFVMGMFCLPPMGGGGDGGRPRFDGGIPRFDGSIPFDFGGIPFDLGGFRFDGSIPGIDLGG